jgi:hypothetical protein
VYFTPLNDWDTYVPIDYLSRNVCSVLHPFHSQLEEMVSKVSCRTSPRITLIGLSTGV